MPTTFRSIETNAKPAVKRDLGSTSGWFIVGYCLLLLLAAAVIIAFPMVLTTGNADPTWLIGP